MKTTENRQPAQPASGRPGPGAAEPWRPDRDPWARPWVRPWVRLSGKLLLDGLVAALGWGLTGSLLGYGLPTFKGTALFTGSALLLNAAFGFTSQHYRLVGLPEARGLLLGTLALAALAMLLCALVDPEELGLGGRDVLLSASLLTGCCWFALRAGVISLHRRRYRPPEPGCEVDPPGQERALIVGAGRAGMRLSQELRENPKVRYRVLGFVDDAPEKQGVRIQGIPVLGPTRRLADYVAEHRATLVILGMAGIPGHRVRELSQAMRTKGIRVKTVPGIQDLVGNRPWKPEVREIAIEDLLRREPVSLDTLALRQALEGSVTLITGAGGSIGSELARRVAAFGPKRLVLLGRGENSLWDLERDLQRHHPGQAIAIALCDIRNPLRLRQVFDAWHPQVVFHAAAHKHVPYLEAHPEEAIGNNIFGTLNVAQAALACGTATFVNVSTDKAVNPTNVLGASKRIGEHLVLQAAGNAPPGARFVSVRFGNVLGSRGSVIPVFRDQISQGGPITVTHPDMVRYFMTIPEACQLVMQAGILGATGKVFALDMGEPVHIVDLAADMARLSGFSPGVDIDIQFTGARPGEKFFEELFGEREVRKPGVHPKVFEAVQDRQDPALLEEALVALKALCRLPEGERQRAILHWFLALVPSYRPSPQGLGRYLQPQDPPSVPAPSGG